jgi:hypothetical protein
MLSGTRFLIVPGAPISLATVPAHIARSPGLGIVEPAIKIAVVCLSLVGTNKNRIGAMDPGPFGAPSDRL